MLTFCNAQKKIINWNFCHCPIHGRHMPLLDNRNNSKINISNINAFLWHHSFVRWIYIVVSMRQIMCSQSIQPVWSHTLIWAALKISVLSSRFLIAWLIYVEMHLQYSNQKILNSMARKDHFLHPILFVVLALKLSYKMDLIKILEFPLYHAEYSKSIWKLNNYSKKKTTETLSDYPDIKS